MFAHGGATLTEHAADVRLRELIEQRNYNAVVLQERGGDDLCAIEAAADDDPVCHELIAAHRYLARLASEQGARVYYLGTYQLVPAVSQRLVAAERRLSAQMVAIHVEISDSLVALRSHHPELPWLHADNGHPGFAATALMAVRIYEALAGRTASPVDLCVRAELYKPGISTNGYFGRERSSVVVAGERCILRAAEMRIIAGGAP